MLQRVFIRGNDKLPFDFYRSQTSLFSRAVCAGPMSTCPPRMGFRCVMLGFKFCLEAARLGIAPSTVRGSTLRLSHAPSLSGKVLGSHRGMEQAWAFTEHPAPATRHPSLVVSMGCGLESLHFETALELILAGSTSITA